MEYIDGLIHISSMKKVHYIAYYEDNNVEKGKFFVVDIKEDTIEGKTIINTYLVFSDTVQNALNFISKAEALPIREKVKAVKETKIIDIIE